MAHTDMIEELEELEQIAAKPYLEEERPAKPELVAPSEARPRPSRRKLLVFVAAVVLVSGVLAWWHFRQYESTDDALVDGHLHAISARVTGTVQWVNPKVVDNQYVEAGTLLFELDPNDYQVALEQAKANLDAKDAALSGSRVGVPITRATAFSQLRFANAGRDAAVADLDAAHANLLTAQHKLQQDEAISAWAERERVRYEGLQDSIVSRSEYDGKEKEARAAVQAVEADRAEVTAAEKRIIAAQGQLAQRQADVDSAGTAPDRVTDAQSRLQTANAQLEQARADVHAAELNLGYTKVYAPVSGIIGRKTLEVGQRIQPGQTLLSIIQTEDIWITANFKETQLQHMRSGQPVDVYVDAFGRKYKGTVENLAGASGTLFSLLPPENANGNFVKVVQRLPVRIRLNDGQDPQHLLRPGMSVEPTVKVR